MKIRSVRGTHDLFGDEINKYNSIKNIVSQNAKLNNYLELQTPIFEFTELFSKPLGEHSDVVLKEMYTFKDRSEDLLTLRPEYTTPMIRAAITNNLLNDLPLKIYGLGPMFRRERPQKGRYRQFNQINFEIFGSNDFIADLELISLGNDILKTILPLSDLELNINFLGSRNNLKQYKSTLSKYFKENVSKLSDESKSKIDLNPLRILDSKNDKDIQVSNSSPKITSSLSEEDKNNYEQIKEGLKSNKIHFVENFNLVRGLDYYCGIVFEFKTKNLGSQDTVLGGGRYDGLIKTLGGPDISGIGWAAGVERISMLMNKIENKQNHVHLAITDEKFKKYLIEVTNKLREEKIPYYWDYKYNLKKSLSRASSNNAQYIILIGENEFNNNFVTIKNLSSSEQYEIKSSNITNFLNDQIR